LGFIIGMAILWGLTALVINPIVNAALKSRMESEGVYAEDLRMLPPDQIQYWQGVYTRIYILWDVIILGLAGFLAGYIFGIVLIGISFSAKGWPGMLAFIGLSFLGAAMRGG